MTQVLLTSFDPFGGRSVNASHILARAAYAGLRGPLKRRVHHVSLPVDHARAAAAIGDLIARQRRGALRRIVMTGEWSGSALRLERHARPGPLAPWRRGVSTPTQGPMPAPFRRRGLATFTSCDAGRYVCDTTFWAAASILRAPGVSVMFVHVPRDVTDPSEPRGRAIAAALGELIAA
ncbi:MAG: hypothetical protein AAF577_16915 [Pseudomonadota bacterium]